MRRGNKERVETGEIQNRNSGKSKQSIGKASKQGPTT